MSEYRTPEEDTITQEDAQRYPGHEDPDSAREDVGLPAEEGDQPDGAPQKRDDA